MRTLKAARPRRVLPQTRCCVSARRSALEHATTCVEAHRMGRGTRTPNRQFWRLLRYQLRHTHMRQMRLRRATSE